MSDFEGALRRIDFLERMLAEARDERDRFQRIAADSHKQIIVLSRQLKNLQDEITEDPPTTDDELRARISSLEQQLAAANEEIGRRADRTLSCEETLGRQSADVSRLDRRISELTADVFCWRKVADLYREIIQRQERRGE